MAGRTAIVLFNLGGPDSLDAVGPYLRNLFSDPAILRLPNPFRGWLAKFLADRRTPFAQKIFAELGGGSPIQSQTQAQADGLSQALAAGGMADARVFIAMRYWHPRAGEVSQAVAAFNPAKVVLLPLYPQFSTTTSASSIAEFETALGVAGYSDEVERICCYPTAPGLIAALEAGLKPAITEARKLGTPRILFSAHGLPQSIVKAGDPYVWQVGETARAVIDALGEPALESEICYQSRVGPMKWTGPSIDEAIGKAVAAKRVLVVVPIAFVSEHSETLVELDIKYRDKALAAGAPGYIRVPALGVQPHFIAALQTLVRAACDHATERPYCNTRICPRAFRACPNV